MRNMESLREEPQRNEQWEFEPFDGLKAEGKDRAFPGKPDNDRGEPGDDMLERDAPDREQREREREREQDPERMPPPADMPDVDLPPTDPLDPGRERPPGDGERPMDERDREPVIDPRREGL